MARRPQSIKPLPTAALLAACLLALTAPLAHAGPVFEMKKPILTNANDYKVIYNLQLTPPGLPGAIIGGATPFNATAIPQFVVPLQKCAVVTLHIHPLGNEQLFVTQGSIEVGIYSEDMVLRQVNVTAGEGVIVPQGTIHYVRNTAAGNTTILALFDHPQAGTNFVPNAVAASPKDVQSGAFMGMPPGGLSPPIFTLSNC